jgi:hypothetical protein
LANEPNGERFTAWFSTKERDMLRRLSDNERVSANTIVRTCVRCVFYDERIPGWLLEAIATDATEATDKRTEVPA